MEVASVQMLQYSTFYILSDMGKLWVAAGWVLAAIDASVTRVNSNTRSSIQRLSNARGWISRALINAHRP